MSGFPDLSDAGLISQENCSDGGFRRGVDGVQNIDRTGDGKVEFIQFLTDAVPVENVKAMYE